MFLKLLNILSLITILVASAFAYGSLQSDIDDCNHMLISHIRTFRSKSWSGFKHYINLSHSLTRRSRATMLIRVPLAEYKGSLAQITDLKLGPDSFQLIPSLKVFVGPYLYMVGEGSSEQILAFGQRWREKLPSVAFEYQILDSEFVQGGLALETKALKLDLSFQDPDVILKSALAEIESSPRRGFAVHELQMQGLVYFFSAKALDPIFSVEGFLNDNNLHISESTEVSAGEAIENNQVQLLSDAGTIVRWRDLYIMNYVAMRTVLDLHGQPADDTPRSSVHVHPRLLELIRACRAGESCTIDVPAAPIKPLVDHVLDIIATDFPSRAASPSVEKPKFPNLKGMKIFPVQERPIEAPRVQEDPSEVDDDTPTTRPKRRAVSSSAPEQRATVPVTPPKRTDTLAKPSVPKAPKKEKLIDENPIPKSLLAALAANSQRIALMKENPQAMAEWELLSENKQRLHLDFYYQDIKHWTEQYEAAVRSQDEGKHKAMTDRLELARDTLAREVIDADKTKQTITLELTFESTQVPELLTKLQTLYTSVAQKRGWDIEQIGRGSNAKGLRSLLIRITGRGADLLEREVGRHRFFKEGAHKQPYTNYVEVKIKDGAPQFSLRAHNSPYVRTYDLMKSSVEEKDLLNGETLKKELDILERDRALERLLKVGG